MDFLSAAKKLISIDSTPAQGTQEAVKFLKDLAVPMGLHVDIMEEVVNGISQANIFVRPNEKKQTLLLQTHLDTVDPGSFALWTKTGFNPFQASIRGDKIYGLGSADVKLDFLCKLYAMKRMSWSERSSTAVLLGTFGEEEQMRGAIRAVRERRIQPSLALIGEPTDLQVIYAGKGIARLEVIIPFASENGDSWDETTASTQSKIFQGKAAHSSSPEMGENAIVKMLEYLDKLPESIQVIHVDGGVSFNTIPTQAALEFDLTTGRQQHLGTALRSLYKTIRGLGEEFKKYPDPAFEPPHATLNIGSVRTHQDHIQILGAVRWTSHVPERTYTEWMNSIATQCKELGAILRILDVKKPFSIDEKSPFSRQCLDTLRSLGVTAELKTQPVTNEANVLSRFGFESLVFGPGRRHNNSHTPEENVALQDLKVAEDFYFMMMEKICL